MLRSHFMQSACLISYCYGVWCVQTALSLSVYLIDCRECMPLSGNCVKWAVLLDKYVLECLLMQQLKHGILHIYSALIDAYNVRRAWQVCSACSTAKPGPRDARPSFDYGAWRIVSLNHKPPSDIQRLVSAAHMFPLTSPERVY